MCVAYCVHVRVCVMLSSRVAEAPAVSLVWLENKVPQDLMDHEDPEDKLETQDKL